MHLSQLKEARNIMSFYSNLPTSQSEHGTESSLYPTIFEILSSQEIDSLLPASIRYILTNYWVARWPSKLSLAVNNYFPEWFGLGLNGLIEWHHIHRYDSTFIDKFYGLQRFNSANRALMNAQAHSLANGSSSIKYWSKGLRLSHRQKRVVLLEKIFIPYLMQKLDDIHSQSIAQSAFTSNANSKVYKWVIEVLYPAFKRLWYILDLLTKLAFLSGNRGSITFLDYIFNIEYTRMILPLEPAVAEGKKLSNEGPRPKKTNLYSIWTNCSQSLDKVGNVLSYSGSQLFPAFIFMLRVYQWWTTQDLSAKIQRKLYDLDKDIPRPNPGERKNIGSTHNCPICKNPIQNPCVLETGYAACYPCAIEFLPVNEGKCPVTGKKLLGCSYDQSLGEWKIITGVRRLLI